MTPMYQIIGWDDNFEGAKSRTYKHKTTCQMPTKHGLGYRRLIGMKDGAAMFGAWCVLIQVLSRHDKPRQGYCTDTGRIDGKAYTPADLELLTGIQARIWKSLLQAATMQDVGWLRIPDGYRTDTTGPLNSDLDLDLDLDSCSGGGSGGGSGDFERFWEAYPRKVGKKSALRSWQRANDRPDTETIISEISLQRNSQEWTKDGGAYIPHPATWINRGGWDDHVTPIDAHGRGRGF